MTFFPSICELFENWYANKELSAFTVMWIEDENDALGRKMAEVSDRQIARDLNFAAQSVLHIMKPDLPDYQFFLDLERITAQSK